jgi:hypothetical protein
MSFDDSLHLHYAGGGMSAMAVAVTGGLLAAHYQRKGYAIKPTTYHIYDKDGAFGRGIPYKTPDCALIANQRSDNMSPFRSNSRHCTQHTGNNPDNYWARYHVGTYGEETLYRTFAELKASHIPVQLETVQATVKHIDAYNLRHGHIITDKGSYPSNGIIISDGHHSDKTFETIENGPQGHCLFNKSSAQNDLSRVITPETESVAMLGNTANTLDNIRLLRACNYQGHIYIFAQKPVRPWAASSPQKDPASYEPSYLNADYLHDNPVTSADDLQTYVYAEIQHAKSTGYRVEDILPHAHPQHFTTLGSQLKDYHQFYKKLYGNVTAPESEKIYRELEESGRLHLVDCRIKPEQIKTYDPAIDTKPFDGFVITDLPDRDPLQVAALFVPPYSRDPLASPLIRLAHQQNLLDATQPITAGQQKDHCLYVVGPATSADKWGLETFAPGYELTACQAMQNLFGWPERPKVDFVIR